MNRTALTRRQANLRRLFRPRHIAFVGGETMVPAMLSCIEAGFDGPVWAVNPTRETLAGVPCFKSVADLPEPPDAAFLRIPLGPTLAVVRELAAIGAGGAVCYAAGYAEVGGEGAAHQAELAAAAGDLALVGPNCYGVLNRLDAVALWPIGQPHPRLERGAAFVAQSGNISLNVAFNRRSVPFAYLISTGNEAVLETADYIEALLDDDRVTAIGVYLETVNDVARFSRAAVRALVQGVPIVALKAGSSEVGRHVALTHTGSLAGSDEAYQALFDRLGVVRADTPERMLEILKALSVTGPLPGNRLSVLTCSGGESAIVADLAQRYGVALPPHAAAQAEALRAELPDFANVVNPLDYNTSLWGEREPLERVFTTAMEGDVDAAMLIIDYLEGSGWQDLVDNAVDALIAAHRKTGRAALHACDLSESMTAEAAERMIAAGIAPLQGLEHAVAAAGAAAAYGVRRSEALADGAEALVLPPAPAPPGDARLLDEAEAKRRLAAFGLAVPAGRVAEAGAAPGVAAEIGFPVALKALSPGLAHKSESGAVRLGLTSAEAVAAAAAEMAARHAGAPLLVEAMVDDAVAELIVGVTRDPDLGLVLVVGSGGVTVELVRDVTTLLIPTDRAAVARALAGLKAAALIAGFRGRPAGDAEAAVDAVLAVARFADAHRDRLAELDVNPLIVRRRGAVAADAMVRIADGEEAEP